MVHDPFLSGPEFSSEQPRLLRLARDCRGPPFSPAARSCQGRLVRAPWTRVSFSFLPVTVVCLAFFPIIGCGVLRSRSTPVLAGFFPPLRTWSRPRFSCVLFPPSCKFYAGLNLKLCRRLSCGPLLPSACKAFSGALLDVFEGLLFVSCFFLKQFR